MRQPNGQPFVRAALAAGIGLAVFNATGCAAEKSPDAKNDTCEFVVYSQNRFKASSGGYGATMRAQPNIDAEIIASFKGNATIQAIGYVVTKAAAYPNNPEAINGDHWIVIKTARDAQGYISDAGIRSAETKHNPSGLSDNLGPLVDFNALPANCDLTTD